MASQILERLNAERAKGGDCRTKGVYAPAASVQWNTKLEAAAIAHSNDMVLNNFFAHVSFDKRTLSDRVNATGYAWSRLGENIAAGYPTVEAVVAGWMASDGHCANMMNPDYKDIAMACVPGTATTKYNNYWTLDFGTAP